MPYADPFRLRVLIALTDLLKTITPANGYAHDLSDSVFRGRAIYGDDDPVPMVSILEPPLAPDQIPSPEEAAESAGDWDLLIQGFAKDDHKNPSDPAYRLLADVKAALAKEKKKPGLERAAGRRYYLLDMENGVTAMQIGFGTVRPPDEVSAKAYFWLTLTLSVAEDLDLPYG